MSDALRDWCRGEGLTPEDGVRGLFRESPDPERIEALRKELSARGFLSQLSIELRGRDGIGVPVTASVLMFCTVAPSEPFLALVAQPPGERTAHGPLDPILESAPEAVLALDARGVITHVNPRCVGLLGMEREALLGRPFSLLVTNARDLEAFAADFPLGEDAADRDLIVRTGSGAALAATATAGALRGGDGESPGTVLVLRALTARRQGHEALVRKTEELEHCVQTLAHDLRSPLVALLGFSRLLRQDYGEQLDETGTHFVDRIEQAGRTMERLIHDVLELSRIGRSGEHRLLVDPRLVLLQLSAELKPRLDATAIHLELPENPPMVYCDRTRLYQVFSNLIGNAIDHMGDCADRRVSVEILEEDDHHRLTVRDRGSGVPEEHREQIFEVFRSLAPRAGGRRSTGIGLAIVKKIAETHGGRAWVESESGRGSAFHVTLSRD